MFLCKSARGWRERTFGKALETSSATLLDFTTITGNHTYVHRYMQRTGVLSTMSFTFAKFRWFSLSLVMSSGFGCYGFDIIHRSVDPTCCVYTYSDFAWSQSVVPWSNKRKWTQGTKNWQRLLKTRTISDKISSASDNLSRTWTKKLALVATPSLWS